MKNIYLNKILTLLLALCLLSHALPYAYAGYHLIAKEHELSQNIERASGRRQLRAAHLEIAEFFRATGRYFEAINAYRKVLEFRPPKRQRYDVYINIGKSLVGLRRYEEALQYYKEAELLYPRRADIKLIIGEFYLRMGLYYLAERKLLEALNIDPNLRVAHRHLGDIYFRQSRYDRALSHYRQLGYPESSYNQIIFNMARSYRIIGNTEEALVILHQALDGSKYRSDILLEIGRNHMRRRDFDSAENYFLKSALASPYNAVAHMYLALARLEGGNPFAAKITAARAAELKPNLASISLLRAMIYLRVNNRAQALAHARAAYDKAKTPVVQSASQRLARHAENY